MATIYPNEGLEHFNKLLSNNEVATNFVFHIYTNEITLSNTLTVADMTELSIADYTAYTTSPTDWVITNGVLSHPAYTWNFTSGGQSVVGYYITIDNKLFFVAEMSQYVTDGAPIVISDLGAQIVFEYTHTIGGV